MRYGSHVRELAISALEGVLISLVSISEENDE
jgi:hypothetical protein